MLFANGDVQKIANPVCIFIYPCLFLSSHYCLEMNLFMCRRAKIFYLPQPGIEPRSLDLRQTLYHVAVKAGFYRKAVEVYFIPSPVTFSPTKLNLIPKVPGHRESFLMRLGNYCQGQLSRVGYLRWAPLS